MTSAEHEQLVEFLGHRFTEIDRRFDEIDQRFTEVGRRFDEMGGEIAEVKDQVAELRREMLGTSLPTLASCSASETRDHRPAASSGCR